VKKALILAGMLIMSGCALLNPYESSFSCPESYNGKCVSVQTAYSESSGLSVKAKDGLPISPMRTAGLSPRIPVPVQKAGRSLQAPILHQKRTVP